MSSQVLAKIGEEILADAHAEAKKRIEEAEKQARELVQKAEEEGRKVEENAEAETREEAKLIEDRRLSEARREASLKILAEKNRLIGQAFKEAEKKLRGIVKGEAYLKSLRHLTALAASQIGSESIKVKLNEKDLERSQQVLQKLKLPSNMKVTFDKKPLKSIGGCVVSTPDGRVVIDETFETRLLFAEKTLKKEVWKILSGG
ncbi:V-type ATP synthase subunit E [Candidatus Hecatella orcuttiae]|uniref:V-type ATP synthase subunit E n=1 Tax=Candidatus Hecatella orcuttiae TaxID=1935119 RepID=UPI002867D59D|nr:V-type ATP synthase subunit E family protein [Candidatus Hecatella orcuttiae]